jgi:hypothetical protein
MKTWIFQRFALALVLASIPLFGGCDQERANSAPVNDNVSDVTTSQPPAEAAMDTNQLAAGGTNQDLADAPGQIISTPETASTNTSNNPQLADFVKLVQAGVGESVLMAYVTNSQAPFNVSSDDVVYLNDLGAPETVISAMLQRDQYFNGNSNGAAATAAPQATYANPAPTPATAPYPDQNAVAQAEETTPTPPMTPPPAVEEEVQNEPNVSYGYFYDSLSPYGSWINIDGYGPCWQPTTVVANPGWEPYCDHGHWAYTDCGWCWVSDYSWGWAPFHYGRWFHHNRWGWCWAPDTVWGPAWVSWRYNDSHCGWAPLPPAACYRPGFGFSWYGRSVGFDFNFGLNANAFVFVPLGHFNDRHIERFRLNHREITKVYNTTVINNTIIRGNNHTIINRGVPVDRVAAATRTEIRPIHVRADANGPRSPRLGRDGESLSVYRPELPTPRPNRAPRLAGEGVQPNTHFDLHSRVNQARVVRNPAAATTPDRRPIISNPAMNRPSENQGRDNRFSQPNGENPNSLIMRGPNQPNRATPSREENNAQTPPQNLRHGPVFQPQTARQETAPGDNRRAFNPRAQQPDQAGSPSVTPPLVNRPDNQQRRNELEQQQQQRVLQQQQQRDFQQQQRDLQQQQRELQRQQREIPQTPVIPRQGPPRSFDTPRENPRVDNNPGFRAEPPVRSEPPRAYEPRPAPEVRSAPPQYSAPARENRQDASPSRGNGGGGGNGNGNNGGNGRNR